MTYHRLVRNCKCGKCALEELKELARWVNELSSSLSVSYDSERGDFSPPKEGWGEPPNFFFPAKRKG